MRSTSSLSTPADVNATVTPALFDAWLTEREAFYVSGWDRFDWASQLPRPRPRPAMKLQPIPADGAGRAGAAQLAAVQPVVELPAISPEPAPAVEPEPVAPAGRARAGREPSSPTSCRSRSSRLSSSTPEPVALDRSLVEPFAEAEPVHVPELEELFAPKRATDFRVVVRLKEGEGVEVGSFRDFGTAMEGAQEVIEQFSTATEGQWPFYAGRFIRPDLIVSVDVVEGGDERL